MLKHEVITELIPVQCVNCKHWIEPEPQYDRNSMGTCIVMKQWLEKFPESRPKPEVYDKNYRKLGGKLYWPYVTRYCQRYEEK